MTPRVRLLFPNRLDGATLSGGSWEVELPLGNLQTRVLQRVARSTDDSPDSTQVDIDFGRERDIDGIVLLNHNLSTSATWRAQAASDAGFSAILYDSAALQAFPAIYNTIDMSWSDPNWWSGLPDQEDLADLPASSIHGLPAMVSARYWRILVSDGDNADGYVQIGRVFVGPAWDPPYNYTYGAQLGVVDPSMAERSLGGASFFDRRPTYRTAAFGFDSLPETESFPALFDLIRRAGATEELFFVPDGTDTLNLSRRSFLARAREPSAIEQVTHGRIGVQFVLEELT